MTVKNFKKIKIHSSGFTLVEILIYVAIYSILIAGFAAFSEHLRVARLHSRILLETESQGERVSRYITQTIRNSSQVLSPLPGTSSGVLSLSDGASSVYTFSESAGTLYVSKNGTSPLPLTNELVKITSLAFSNYASSSSKGSVTLRFTLKNSDNAVRAGEQYSADFYGTATVR